MKNCEGDRELYEEVTDTVSSILGRKMKKEGAGAGRSLQTVALREM